MTYSAVQSVNCPVLMPMNRSTIHERAICVAKWTPQTIVHNRAQFKVQAKEKIVEEEKKIMAPIEQVCERLQMNFSCLEFVAKFNS